jgi:predicted transcriptional regulator YheO
MVQSGTDAFAKDIVFEGGKDREHAAIAIELYSQKKLNVIQICESLGISKPTLYAYIRRQEGKRLPL